MNAVHLPVRDIGPIQERYTTLSWSVGDVSGETELMARYRINYPSLLHRGLGRDPDVQLLGVYARDTLDEWRVKSLSPAQWMAVIAEIETDELPQD